MEGCLLGYFLQQRCEVVWFAELGCGCAHHRGLHWSLRSVRLRRSRVLVQKRRLGRIQLGLMYLGGLWLGKS